MQIIIFNTPASATGRYPKLEYNVPSQKDPSGSRETGARTEDAPLAIARVG